MRYVTSKIGSRKSQTTIYFNEEKNIQIVCGCFRGDIDKFECAVKETHAENELYLSQYLEQIKIFRFLTSKFDNK